MPAKLSIGNWQRGRFPLVMGFTAGRALEISSRAVAMSERCEAKTTRNNRCKRKATYLNLCGLHRRMIFRDIAACLAQAAADKVDNRELAESGLGLPGWIERPLESPDFTPDAVVRLYGSQ